MIVREFKIKKVVTTRAELEALGEWEFFASYFKLDEQGMLDCKPDEEFVVDPVDAAFFKLLPTEEATKLEDFYNKQLETNG